MPFNALGIMPDEFSFSWDMSCAMGIFRTGYFPSAEPKPRRLYLVRLLCTRAMRGSTERCGVQKQNAQDKTELSLIHWTWGLFIGDLRAYAELQLVDMRELVVQWYTLNFVYPNAVNNCIGLVYKPFPNR